jgi:hypothetical protein
MMSSSEHDIAGDLRQVSLARLAEAAESRGYKTHCPRDDELEIQAGSFFLDIYPSERRGEFLVGGDVECDLDELDEALAQVRGLLEDVNARFDLEVLEEGDADRTRFVRDSVRPADSNTVTYELGSAYAPDSPWGLDRLIVYGDGCFRYENQVKESVLHVATGSLTPEAAGQLNEALTDAGFPAVPEHETPPGGGYMTITRGEERAFFCMSIRRLSTGYGFLIETLDRWVAYLRGNSGEQVAPAELLLETEEGQ